jgi:hypothetical protein
MRQPNLIDGRRIYNPDEFNQKLKFVDIGLGSKNAKVGLRTNLPIYRHRSDHHKL